jgi:hypothetical protein
MMHRIQRLVTTLTMKMAHPPGFWATAATSKQRERWASNWPVGAGSSTQ